MERIILDTNVYGLLVTEPKIVEIIKELNIRAFMIFYGVNVVRNEIRDISPKQTYEDKKLRILVLNLYDSLIKKANHDLKITTLIETTAKEYFNEYKGLGGSLSFKEMANDFLIIACASLHSLDIVVSHDLKTMLSGKSINAYKTINKKFQLRTPEFKPYVIFRQELIKLHKELMRG